MSGLNGTNETAPIFTGSNDMSAEMVIVACLAIMAPILGVIGIAILIRYVIKHPRMSRDQGIFNKGLDAGSNSTIQSSFLKPEMSINSNKTSSIPHTYSHPVDLSEIDSKLLPKQRDGSSSSQLGITVALDDTNLTVEILEDEESLQMEDVVLETAKVHCEDPKHMNTYHCPEQVLTARGLCQSDLSLSSTFSHNPSYSYVNQMNYHGGYFGYFQTLGYSEAGETIHDVVAVVSSVKAAQQEVNKSDKNLSSHSNEVVESPYHGEQERPPNDFPETFHLAIDDHPLDSFSTVSGVTGSLSAIDNALIS